MKLEKWEVNDNITIEYKVSIINTAEAKLRETLGDVQEWFDISLEVTDYGFGGGILVDVFIANNENELLANNVYAQLCINHENGASIIFGDDCDISEPLTTGNLFKLMYCQSFAIR